MSYTIKLLDVDRDVALAFLHMLQVTIHTTGRFVVNAVTHDIDHRLGSLQGSRRPGYRIELRRIRLKAAKPYCGQHPGECAADGRKKLNATYLEWDDWVEFHGVVNNCIGLSGLEADVWSTPQDCKGPMWIRKGARPRVRWEYEEKVDRFGRPIRLWNQGTDDQFVGASP